ncbi:MAG: TerB family tellurite resistance protein [Ramlibacter sp.]
MLNTLSDLFGRLTAAPGAQRAADHAHTLQLAAAVLLAEVMRAQPEISPAERAAALAALQRRFALDADELARLLGQAEAQAAQANDFYRFTSRLNDHCSQPDKVALVEAMWQVAYADGALDAHENHVISKVAGLLHVTHGDYIAAKLRAREQA